MSEVKDTLKEHPSLKFDYNIYVKSGKTDL